MKPVLTNGGKDLSEANSLFCSVHHSKDMLAMISALTRVVYGHILHPMEGSTPQLVAEKKRCRDEEQTISSTMNCAKSDDISGQHLTFSPGK